MPAALHVAGRSFHPASFLGSGCIFRKHHPRRYIALTACAYMRLDRLPELLGCR